MARFRLRHPEGTAQLELDVESATVLDLQQRIAAATGILPSRQVLRTGYPPKALELVPELPLASLGIRSGDQLIVSSSEAAAAAPVPAPAPAPAPARPVPSDRAPAAASKAASDGVEHVQTDSGVLIHRVVPDDNSCLFSSLAIIFTQDITQAQAIRQAAADTIRADSGTFSEAILGCPREQYLATLLRPQTWGGALELAALAARFGTEIASVDVETGRVDAFPPPGGAQTRCVVFYAGIHYDAAVLAPTLDAPAEWHQTQFTAVGTIEQDPVVQAAKKLADKLRAKRKFTNTATFTLRCEVCKAGLTGEKEARAHATQTGHTAFGEY